MEIRRRDFLKLFGGLSGAVLFSGCGFEEVFDVPEALVARARNGPGIETWTNTICRLCPAGCGIRVRLMDEIPVYVKGNPNYPVNQGGMCPLGLSALHSLYNPDRLKGPMKRVGPPGSGRWEAISWDNAMRIVSDALIELRNEGKSHQVALLGYDERGLMKEHITRFMQAYGSPNYFQFSPAQNDTVPYLLVHGQPQIPACDFLNAKLVLSFGSNFLEEGYSPIYYTKLYTRHQAQGTRYIQIESRMSLTAGNADRWIPIHPGTYGALALGLAYVLIREELYDSRFVNTHTFGFEDWKDRKGEKHLGFKSNVLGNYYPERVSGITGVSSTTILELGRELGQTRPALVLGDGGAIDNANGTFSLMAVQSLNALLGNYEREGGVFFVDEPPFAPLPAVVQDQVAKDGNQQTPIAHPQDLSFPLTSFSIESFSQNVLADRPYPISVLFLYKGNPLLQTLNNRDLANALKKIPLVVSFDSVISQTSEYAHLVLPENTFLEQWDEISNVPSVGFTHVGLQQPVVKPLYDTRNLANVVIKLAKQIGGTVAASFPFENYEGVIEYRARGIYKSGQGAIASEGVRRFWLEYLHQRGWQLGRYASFEEFWEQLYEHGGWWNPIRKQKQSPEIFQTPSRKFEFYSQKLKAAIDSLVERLGKNQQAQNLETVLSRLDISARGDKAFLPHHEPVSYEADMPLHLITFRVLPNPDGQAANLPLMQEMFGYTVRRYWDSWIEIHPETAAAHGISDGALVRVESAIGSIKVPAKLNPGIMSYVVAIPFGLGHTSYGRYAKGRGANPYAILRNHYDLLSGKPALEATKVKISLEPRQGV